jgi:hypothetical protein
MQNKDIKPHNDKGKRHGYWEEYFSDGDFWFHCYYVNFQKYGFVNIRNKLYRYHAK